MAAGCGTGNRLGHRDCERGGWHSKGPGEARPSVTPWSVLPTSAVLVLREYSGTSALMQGDEPTCTLPACLAVTFTTREVTRTKLHETRQGSRLGALYFLYHVHLSDSKECAVSLQAGKSGRKTGSKKAPKSQVSGLLE